MKFLYHYAAGDSFLHRLDPVTKLVTIVLVLFILFMVINPLVSGGILLFFMTVLYVGGKITPAAYWKLFLFFLPLLIVMSLVQAFVHTPAHRILFTIGPLQASLEGFIHGARIAMRLCAMGISFLVFSMTTTPQQIERSLVRLRVPYRYAFFVGFGLRFVPLIQEELNDLRNAMTLRGYPHLNPWNPVSSGRFAFRILPPMMIGTLRRSIDIALAMELRGWGGADRRTHMAEQPLYPRDRLVMVLAVTALLATFTLRYILDYRF